MKKTNSLYLSFLFIKAFFTMLAGLVPIWGGLSLIILILGMYIGVKEGLGWQDGLYFGLITGTTIGYGDIVPTLTVTRFLSVIIGIVGLINTGIIVAIAALASRIAADRSGIIGDIKDKLQDLTEDSRTEGG